MQHAYKSIQIKFHIRDKRCHGVCKENGKDVFVLELFNF